MARATVDDERRSSGMRFVQRNICDRMHVENQTVTSTEMDASELKKLKSSTFSYSGAVSWPNTLMMKLCTDSVSSHVLNKQRERASRTVCGWHGR